MTEKQANKIFEKYNPAASVVRCPCGRAKLRKPLDLYAKAAVNLYGIIRRDEFVEIFNSQNDEKTTVDEVFTILLPNVLKNKWYGFYKEYIVHYIVLHDFDWVENLEKHQSGKPRYIPSKEKFLKYEDEWYTDNDYWDDVFDFMIDSFGCKPDTIEAFERIKISVTQTRGIKELGAIMNEFNLIFHDEKNVQQFIDLIMPAMNNTRIWENKGHTPAEIVKLSGRKPFEDMVIPQKEKVGVNQPCPCGSGKKFKKCCKAISESGTAQLSQTERKEFYETWYKLLDFVNQKYKIFNMRINPVYPNNYDESQLHVIREKLWENPKVISEFLTSADNLSNEEINLLQSWEKKHIKGKFILMNYSTEYAILMQVKESDVSALYAVKGMTTSIAEAMQRRLPVMLETVLVPFKDKIIYDSYMGSHPVSFGSGMREMFNKEFNRAMDKNGIITTLM